jgi:hypothetical protein
MCVKPIYFDKKIEEIEEIEEIEKNARPFPSIDIGRFR